MPDLPRFSRFRLALRRLRTIQGTLAVAGLLMLLTLGAGARAWLSGESVLACGQSASGLVRIPLVFAVTIGTDHPAVRLGGPLESACRHVPPVHDAVWMRKLPVFL